MLTPPNNHLFEQARIRKNQASKAAFPLSFPCKTGEDSRILAILSNLKQTLLGDFYKAKDDAEMVEVMCERKKRERSLSKFQGCLVDGAAGNALGFAVEFMSGGSIIELKNTAVTEFETEKKTRLIQ
ncbi:hypothetical protein [Adlercreutzia sp. ZJ138]|uniref:hypothetical protein n=1 Tax=Adlercreutzia sp. ZJ138 TaxID=2709405 RepID=UPI0013EC9E02|nr:hypothetical protein [Adlercreutzia sp. ZJ138]